MEKMKKIAFVLLGVGAVFLFFFPQLQEAMRSKEIQKTKEDSLAKAREAKLAKQESKVLEEIKKEIEPENKSNEEIESE